MISRIILALVLWMSPACKTTEVIETDLFGRQLSSKQEALPMGTFE